MVFEPFVTWDFKDADYVDLLPSGLLVPHYLIHCACYYEFNDNLITDRQFDQLARRLFNEWDGIKHMHKRRIERDALLSGGSYIELPLMVRCSAARLLGEATGRPVAGAAI